MRIGAVIVIVWLLIGVIAAGQRGSFRRSPHNCANAATDLATIVAGPLNYLGMRPSVDCQAAKALP